MLPLNSKPEREENVLYFLGKCLTVGEIRKGQFWDIVLEGGKKLN